MKKLLIVVAIVLGSIGFSTSILAAQATVENPKITSEQAKEIALKQSKNGKFKEIELKHKNFSCICIYKEFSIHKSFGNFYFIY